MKSKELLQLTTKVNIHCNKLLSIFHGLYKQVPKNVKGRSTSSQHWLTRQLNDPYVEKAKMSNYRCRSAFKLIEINNRYHILSPGFVAVDCGAAPGSWTQVLVECTNSNGKSECAVGKVVAIDRCPVYPINGAIILQHMDFTTPSTQEKLIEVVGKHNVDIVVSDMAPNATGVRCLDQENIIHLAYCALRFSLHVSRVGATFLVKVWDGGNVPKLKQDMERFYSSVKFVRPAACRSDSTENFILARGFKGLATNTAAVSS